MMAKQRMTVMHHEQEERGKKGLMWAYKVVVKLIPKDGG